ncbi:autophagy-related protein 18a-like [Oryza brachyantha]|uniref:autophagy-related protein 18a-like n=1 Tax=Oryza brachyantha TaxID=4533 RepID=UPI001ADD50BE|nr:autophagy-related protein 18a-like [Oryza brachyantha]
MAAATTSPAVAGGEKPGPLVHVAFNPFSTCFIAATATGLHVFSCADSLHRVLHWDDVAVCPCPADSGWKVVMAEMYNEAFAAVVFRRKKDGGSGGCVDKICLWCVPNGRMFPMDKDLPFDVVRGLCLAGEYMLVAGDDRTVLYEIPYCGSSVKKVKAVETAPNPLGAGALVQPDSGARFVMVAPQKMKGMLQVHRLADDHVYVRAHRSAAAAFALSHDGRLLATAGSKGTLVRIFSTSDGKLLQEVRRGSGRANIYSIAFSFDSKWLVVSSDKGTIHVFRINVELASASSESSSGHNATEAPSAKTPQRSSSYMKGLLLPSYFTSERSLAQFHLREGVKYLVAFSIRPNIVIIVGMDGSFYRCQFDPENGGEMKQLQYTVFFEQLGEI